MEALGSLGARASPARRACMRPMNSAARESTGDPRRALGSGGHSPERQSNEMLFPRLRGHDRAGIAVASRARPRGLAGRGPYKTILEAIADSKEGDSIYVKAGQYQEGKTSPSGIPCASSPRPANGAGDRASGAAATFLVQGHGPSTSTRWDPGAGDRRDGGDRRRGRVVTVTTASCAAKALGSTSALRRREHRRASSSTACSTAPPGVDRSAGGAVPQALVRNNIFYVAKTALALNNVGADLTHNNFFNCADITKPPQGNYLNLVPGFISTANWDYRLSPQMQSECFDLGHPPRPTRTRFPMQEAWNVATSVPTAEPCTGSTLPTSPRRTRSRRRRSQVSPLVVAFDVTFTETGDGTRTLTWFSATASHPRQRRRTTPTRRGPGRPS